MFKKWKQARRRQMKIQFQVLETLSTICLYLEWDGRTAHNRYAQFFDSHFRALKNLSDELRKELEE